MGITKRDLILIGIGEGLAFLLQLTGAIRMPMQSITINGFVITWPFYFTLHAAIFIFIIYVVRFAWVECKRSRPPEKLKRLERDVKCYSESNSAYWSIDEPRLDEMAIIELAEKLCEKLKKICGIQIPHPHRYSQFFSAILPAVKAGDTEVVKNISEREELQKSPWDTFRDSRNEGGENEGNTE